MDVACTSTMQLCRQRHTTLLHVGADTHHPAARNTPFVVLAVLETLHQHGMQVRHPRQRPPLVQRIPVPQRGMAMARRVARPPERPQHERGGGLQLLGGELTRAQRPLEQHGDVVRATTEAVVRGGRVGVGWKQCVEGVEGGLLTQGLVVGSGAGEAE